MRKSVIDSINRLFDLITVEYSKPCPSARAITQYERRIDAQLEVLATL